MDFRYRLIPDSHFKLIISVEISLLIEDGRLSLSNTVFGLDGILNYEIPDCLQTAPVVGCIIDTTMRHLLEHSAEAWDNLNKDVFPYEDLDTNNQMGYEMTTQVSYQPDRLPLEVGAGVRYRNSDLNQFLYGVTQSESVVVISFYSLIYY